MFSRVEWNRTQVTLELIYSLQLSCEDEAEIYCKLQLEYPHWMNGHKFHLSSGSTLTVTYYRISDRLLCSNWLKDKASYPVEKGMCHAHIFALKNYLWGRSESIGE